MYVLGIDIGSTSSKVVILDKAENIIASAIVIGGAGTSGPDRAIEEAFARSGLTWDNVSLTIATGYGRMSFEKANKQISEITCHALGVYHLIPLVRTIIDIGGQDVKVMSISSSGLITKFAMNDKCAAGTGRFLEVMARVLETDISRLSDLAKTADSVVDISNTCTVFAESEVISRLASGVKPSNIAAGIHESVARRVAGLVKRVGVNPTIVLTGGVAQNQGIVSALAYELKHPVIVAPSCQITGAIGAGLLALREVNAERSAGKIQ